MLWEWAWPTDCLCFTGRLLDISSPVKATASSYNTMETGLHIFAPQLAIQADTSSLWANCFVSKKEVKPWYRLEFKSETSVFNVQLGVRDGGEQLPTGFNLRGMAKLSVYVSDSSALSHSENQRCGNPWNYSSTEYIIVSCGRILKGRFIHVSVPSTSATYLLICSIVINRENGNMKVSNSCRCLLYPTEYMLQLLEPRADQDKGVQGPIPLVD